jgi:hypothetical protein
MNNGLKNFVDFTWQHTPFTKKKRQQRERRANKGRKCIRKRKGPPNQRTKLQHSILMPRFIPIATVVFITVDEVAIYVLCRILVWFVVPMTWTFLVN